MTNLSVRSLLLAGLLVGAALVLMGREHSDNKEIRGISADELVRASDCPPRSISRWRSATEGLSKWDRELRDLSLGDLRKALPEDLRKSKLASLWQRKTRAWDEREVALFRRFGAVGGREALDEILERYGPGTSSGYAMTMALVGWMERDLSSAMSAFEEMMVEGEQFRMLGMHWNGKQVVSGFG